MNDHLLISKKLNKPLSKIFGPLFRNTKVRYFSYNRFYPDQTWIGLYSDIKPVEIDLCQKIRPILVHENGVILESGTYLFKDLKDLLRAHIPFSVIHSFFKKDKNPIGKKIVENSLLIVKKNSLYDEVFCFSLLNQDISDRLYFYSVLNQLKEFSVFFVDRANKIIAEAEKSKTKIQFNKKSLDQSSDYLFFEENKNKSWLEIKKFCFPSAFGDIYLSKKEMLALQFLVDGLTYDEISTEMALSKRTVESYVRSIKTKLNVFSKKDLIFIYKKSFYCQILKK